MYKLFCYWELGYLLVNKKINAQAKENDQLTLEQSFKDDGGIISKIELKIPIKWCCIFCYSVWFLIVDFYITMAWIWEKDKCPDKYG